MADAESIKRYLLGNMSDDERVRFEDQYFSDTERFAELEAEEDDLVDAFVRGELSNLEEQQFKREYLSSVVRRDKVDFARALNELIWQQKRGSPEKSTSRWWPFGALSDWSNGWPRVAFAAAGFTLVVVCGIWSLTQNRKLRIELNQVETARAELQRSHDALALQIASLTKPAPEATPETGPNTELARVEQRPFPGESLTLTPGMVRGGRQGVPTLALPLHGPSVQLRLILAQDGREHGAYDAAVRTAEEQEPIFTEKRLKLTKSSDGSMVVLHLPSRFAQLRRLLSDAI